MPSVTTSDTAAARPLTRIRVPFFLPVGRILPKVLRAFEAGAAVVEVKGFPLRVFCVRDPQLVSAVLQDRPVGETKLPALLPRVKEVMRGGGYILAGGAHWQGRRREVQEAFRRDDLQRLAALVPALAAEMLDRWQAHARSGRAFDCSEELRLLITRLNMRLFCSSDVAGEELRWLSECTYFTELNFVRLLPLWIPLPSHLRFRRITRKMRVYFLELVQGRRSSRLNAPGDLLQHLLGRSDPETGRPWSDDEVVDELLSVYFGASVMSTSLSWALSLMGSHASAQDRMLAEIVSVLGARPLEFTDLEHLDYTDRAMKEVLRLYPPSWGYPRHVKDEWNIAGHRVPPNSVVIPMVLHMQHDAANWPDPLRFDPDRHGADRPRTGRPAQAVFGAGPRTCLGAALAPMVMKLILAAIVQRYRIEFRPRFEGDPRIAYGFEMHPHDKVMIRIRSRSPAAP